MEFPQYLWRIGNRNGWIMVRRGNTPEEPLEKFFRNDAWEVPEAELLNFYPVGVESSCKVGDAEFYSGNHHWDWFNE